MTASPLFPEILQRRYVPVATLGQGGMGRVFKVRDRTLNRVAALKMLLQASDKRHRARFLREAQISSQIRHPNVVEVYDFGFVERIPYLVMEFVPGRSLDQVKSVPDALGVLMAVAAALEALHQEKIIHRDVKPANVLLSEDGRAVLTDFGLAKDPEQEKLTATGRVLGTLAYMAPELLREEPITPAVDWWAWAVMLFELTEGRKPFNRAQIMAMACDPEFEVPRLEFSDPETASARAVRACLRKDPGTRAQSVQEIAALMRKPEPSRSDPPPQIVPPVPVPNAQQQAPTPLRKLPWVAGMIGTLLVLALSYRPPPPPTPEPPPQTPSPSRLAMAANNLSAALAQIPELSSSDPWVSAKAWRRPATTHLLAELATVADIVSLSAEDQDALERVDQVSTGAGAPAMLEPLLTLRPAVRPVPRPPMVEHEPLWNRDLPATATGYLGSAYEAFPDYLNATAQLKKDVQAFLRNRAVPDSFPFHSDQAGPTFLRNQVMFEAKLSDDPTVREQARAWFRPAIRATRRFYAAVGACLRQEPENRLAAFTLGSAETIRTKYIWLSHLSVISPDLLLGGAETSPEADLLRAHVLNRQWTVYRSAPGRTSGFPAEIREAVLSGLSAAPTGSLGNRHLWIGIELLLDLELRERSVANLRPLLARFLPRVLKIPDPRMVGILLQATMRAEVSALPKGLLTSAQAEAILNFLTATPQPWMGRVSPEEDARWRSRLAIISS